MLHLTNGDSAADLIRRTGVTGEVIAWRDILHECGADRDRLVPRSRTVPWTRPAHGRAACIWSGEPVPNPTRLHGVALLGRAGTFRSNLTIPSRLSRGGPPGAAFHPPTHQPSVRMQNFVPISDPCASVRVCRHPQRPAPLSPPPPPRRSRPSRRPPRPAASCGNSGPG